MRARYDLRECIASHDFYSWLVTIAATGASSIVFGIRSPKTTKWSEREVLERFDTILRPGPALLGMRYEIGDDGESLASPHFRELVRRCSGGLEVPRLRTALPPGASRYTITLRDVPGSKWRRNSSRGDWLRFAREIDATVIEDYRVRPTHLHERVSLYAGAEMNYFLVGGPAHLCSLTRYPCAVFGVDKHFPRGERYPWLLENQHLTWRHGEYDELMRWHEEWLRGGGPEKSVSVRAAGDQRTQAQPVQ